MTNNFVINGKVALVTGGLSGIGLTYAKQLLENGVKGVTLADINEKISDKVVRELEEQYGRNKVIFVKCDVVDYQQFENAFKRTVAAFDNVDILINNAGIYSESNELCRKTIEINTIGVLNGILLGLETYLSKHVSGNEGLIVNTSSTSGLGAFPKAPIYAASKFGVIGATLSFGHHEHYVRKRVRVVTICPGPTLTPLIINANVHNEKSFNNRSPSMPVQKLQEIAPELLHVIRKAPNGTIWVLENGEPAYQYLLPDRLEVPKIYL